MLILNIEGLVAYLAQGAQCPRITQALPHRLLERGRFIINMVLGAFLKEGVSGRAVLTLCRSSGAAAEAYIIRLGVWLEGSIHCSTSDP